MLLLGGEGPMAIEQGKGGKGGKGGGITVGLLDGFVKFRTDQVTAERIQKLRAALHDGFQAFCQKPGNIPPGPTLAMFDLVAALLSGKTAGAPGSSGGKDFSGQG